VLRARGGVFGLAFSGLIRSREAGQGRATPFAVRGEDAWAIAFREDRPAGCGVFETELLTTFRPLFPEPTRDCCVGRLSVLIDRRSLPSYCVSQQSVRGRPPRQFVDKSLRNDAAKMVRIHILEVSLTLDKHMGEAMSRLKSCSSPEAAP
jgi:hypothetical protein